MFYEAVAFNQPSLLNSVRERVGHVCGADAFNQLDRLLGYGVVTTMQRMFDVGGFLSSSTRRLVPGILPTSSTCRTCSDLRWRFNELTNWNVSGIQLSKHV